MVVRRLLVSLGTLSLVALLALAEHPGGAAAQAGPAHHTVAVTGLKQVGAYGVRVDITLDIPPGADIAAVARDALARQGTQPVADSAPALQAVLPSVRWPQFDAHGNQTAAPVQQFYNPAGETVPGGARQALQSGDAEWTTVPTATYAVQYAGTTTRGAAFDRVNVVSWTTQSPGGPDALAVTTTYFELATGFLLDADVQLNANVAFFANPVDLTPARYDFRYVLLHENGHVAGLGHSPDPAAVMYPFFTPGSVGHGLAQGDIWAISRLYPPHPLPPPVPFHSTLRGSIQLQGAAAPPPPLGSAPPPDSGPPPPSLFTMSFSGTGTGTAMGASTVQGYGEVIPVSSLCAVITGHATITAANGDQLTILLTDLACATPSATAVSDGTGSYRVSTGTGRFAGADGSGDVAVHADFTQGDASGTFTLTLSGTLAYLTTR
jgi:hypothetical protein